MSNLQIFLFGQFQVRFDEQVLVDFDGHKVQQELFSYLVLYRDRRHPREMLADLLWGDCSTAQAKGYLRKALWQLQTTLDAQLEPNNGRVLVVEADWVQINPKADLWLDVAEFERAFMLVQGLSGQEIDFRGVQVLREAVNLYQGDLLEGWYQDWCLYKREQLQHMYLAMVDKLMDYCQIHHEYETGLIYGMRILRYDRARERTHRRLMRMHYLAGDRTAALRQYERCVSALDEELSVRPSKRTVALYEQIRADQIAALPRAPSEVKTTVTATTAPLSEVLGNLKRLQAILSDFQHQVQQDIETVELAMNSRP